MALLPAWEAISTTAGLSSNEPNKDCKRVAGDIINNYNNCILERIYKIIITDIQIDSENGQKFDRFVGAILCGCPYHNFANFFHSKVP